GDARPGPPVPERLHPEQRRHHAPLLIARPLALPHMRFLLTSSGVTNASIRNALVQLLGRPIAECSALVIPTAAYYFAQGPGIAYRLISGKGPGPLCELGWKSVGVLELAALPSVDSEKWIPLVREVDALLVGGGDPMYLC